MFGDMDVKNEFAIKKILHASIIVSNTELSLEFYRDILGLSVDHSRPNLGFPGAFINVTENQQIHLLELSNPDPVKNRPDHAGRDRHIAFSVSNLGELEKILIKNKILFTRSKSGRSALFTRDPDGNGLEFIEEI